MYYYIDTPDNPVIDVFVPRIPHRRMLNENDTTPRICLSTSIEGCFSAAPWGADSLSYQPKYIVYRVYEFHEDKIPKDHIYTTKKLMKEHLVPDAEYTDELWIVGQTLRPDNMYYIILDNYETYVAEEENLDFFEYVKTAFYHRANDIANLQDIWFTIGYTSEEDDWIRYILTEFVSTYEKCFVDKSNNGKIILTFSASHFCSLEHLDMLAHAMEKDGIDLGYHMRKKVS